jgi:flagellar transcriptional activator FlhC
MFNSHTQQAFDIATAIRLIKLRCRLQVLEEELSLSREALLSLYKDTVGESPPKGMLPYSEDWFAIWQPNIHASLFMGYYQILRKHTKLSPLELLIKSYEMYLEEVSRYSNYDEKNPVFSITRAWMMLRMMRNGHPMLRMTTCNRCKGNFVTITDKSPVFHRDFVCGLSNPPARAGKRRPQ